MGDYDSERCLSFLRKFLGSKKFLSEEVWMEK